MYSSADVDALVGLYLGNADRDKLDPSLDACVASEPENWVSERALLDKFRSLAHWHPNSGALAGQLLSAPSSVDILGFTGIVTGRV